MDPVRTAWFGVHAPAARRVVLAAGFGVLVAGVAAVLGARWQFVVLLGWDNASMLFLAMVWFAIGPLGAEVTAAVSTREDAGRRVSRVVLLAASSASLVGVGFGLALANRSHGAFRFWMAAAVMGGVVAAWAVVHTVYTLHYAHLYYSRPIGGITFPGGDAPDYLDFAYVAFTLGMTFQVSDNTLATRPVRRAALAHCLLSYLFGTVIIATSINLVANLVA